MRTALIPYINQYVLGQGWIGGWENNKETKSYRFYIDKPTIKKPNKNLLFEEQELISQEDHINLFWEYGDVKDITLPFKKYQQVQFTGCVNEYRRKDGSYDYGVYPVPYSKLESKLNQLALYVKRICKTIKRFSDEELYQYEWEVKPQIKRLLFELEDAGDLLPTFYSTYSHYKTELNEMKRITNEITKDIRGIHGNRTFRRKYKIERNSAVEIPEFNWNN
jgi:hypothetical protein